MKTSYLDLLRAVLAVGLASAATSAFAQTWNFDSSAQGWRVNDLAGSGNYVDSEGVFPVDFHATGGNPGGFISQIDQSGFSFMFEAPSAQLGNYSQFLGGNLRFSLETDQDPDFSTDSVIVFRGGASNITLVSAISPQPNATWTNYLIGLTADQFRYGNLGGAVVSEADFSNVLGDLGVFYIDAEYHNGIAETTGLDSVMFSAPAVNSAVPEADTYGVFGSGVLLALVCLRRKSRESKD